MFSKINAHKKYTLMQDRKALTGADGNGISIGQKTWTDRFYVITILSQPVIIGAMCLKDRLSDLINSDKFVRLKDNKGCWQSIPYK